MTESDENQAQLTPRQITALPCFATNASIESSCEAADIFRENGGQRCYMKSVNDEVEKNTA